MCVCASASGRASPDRPLGCRDLNEAVFDFGVEIQWRAMLFRKGEQRAAQDFYINFGDFGCGASHAAYTAHTPPLTPKPQSLNTARG